MWIEHTWTADVNKEVNLFETTIRVLGGLLSMFTLSKDDLFLHKAVSNFVILDYERIFINFASFGLWNNEIVNQLFDLTSY